MHNSSSVFNSFVEALRKAPSLRVTFSITMTAVMSVSIITPALPFVMEDLNLTRQQVTLLITMFTLPGVVAAPLYGILSDRIGRARMMPYLLFIFGIAGAICGLQRDFNLLLLFRFIQGIGGAGLFTLNNALIGDMFKEKRRMQVMGWNASFISLGTAAYPALGGLLAQHHWSIPFYAPAIGIVVGFMAIKLLDFSNVESSDSFRTYLYSITDIFKNKKILYLLGLNFLTFIVIFGPMISYLPLWLSSKFDTKSSLIGLILSSTAVSAGIVSSQLGRLSLRFKPKTLLFFAFLLYSISLSMLPIVNQYFGILVATLLFGSAQGANLPIVQSMILGEAPPKLRGIVMSFNTTTVMGAISIAPMLAGLIVSSLSLSQMFFAFSALAFLIGITVKK